MNSFQGIHFAFLFFLFGPSLSYIQAPIASFRDVGICLLD